MAASRPGNIGPTMSGRLRAGSLVVIVVCLAACSTSSPRPQGLLQGTFQERGGAKTDLARLYLTVAPFTGGGSSHTIHLANDASFSIKLPIGTYSIDGEFLGGPGGPASEACGRASDPPSTFEVRANATTHFDYVCTPTRQPAP